MADVVLFQSTSGEIETDDSKLVVIRRWKRNRGVYRGRPDSQPPNKTSGSSSQIKGRDDAGFINSRKLGGVSKMVKSEGQTLRLKRDSKSH